METIETNLGTRAPAAMMAACVTHVRLHGLDRIADMIEKAYELSGEANHRVTGAYIGESMRVCALVKEIGAKVADMIADGGEDHRLEEVAELVQHILHPSRFKTAPQEARRIGGNPEARESVPVCTRESGVDEMGVNRSSEIG